MKTKTVVRHLLAWQLLSSRLVPLKGKFIGGKEREGEGEEEKWRGGQTIKRTGEVRWALEMKL